MPYILKNGKYYDSTTGQVISAGSEQDTGLYPSNNVSNQNNQQSLSVPSGVTPGSQYDTGYYPGSMPSTGYNPYTLYSNYTTKAGGVPLTQDQFNQALSWGVTDFNNLNPTNFNQVASQFNPVTNYDPYAMYSQYTSNAGGVPLTQQQFDMARAAGITDFNGLTPDNFYTTYQRLTEAGRNPDLTGVPTWAQGTYNPDPGQGVYSGTTGDISTQPAGANPGSSSTAPQYGPSVDTTGGAYSTYIPDQQQRVLTGFDQFWNDIHSVGNPSAYIQNEYNQGRVDPQWIVQLVANGFLPQADANYILYGTAYPENLPSETSPGLPSNVTPIDTQPQDLTGGATDTTTQTISPTLLSWLLSQPTTQEPTAYDQLLSALGTKATDYLNQPYGYTDAEQQAIWDNQNALLERGIADDTNRLNNLFQQYGWNQNVGEMGGQAQSSLGSYFGDLALARSNMSTEMAKDFADARMTDELSKYAAALSGANFLGSEDQRQFENALNLSNTSYSRATQDFNDWLNYGQYQTGQQQSTFSDWQAYENTIYGENQGDFADYLSWLGFQDQATNSEFTRGLEALQYQSEEEQRNFLNQYNINDAQIQDAIIQANFDWSAVKDIQALRDAGLGAYVDYYSQFDLTPSQLLGAVLSQQDIQSGIYNSGINAASQQTDQQSLMWTLLGAMLAGEMNGGTGTSTTVNNESPDMSWLGDILGGLTGTIGNLASNVSSPDMSWLGDLFSGLGNVGNLDFGNIDWNNPLSWGKDIVGSLFGILPTGASITFGNKTYRIGSDGKLVDSASADAGLSETSGDGAAAAAAAGGSATGILNAAFGAAVIGGIIKGIYDGSEQYKEAVMSQGGQARHLVANTIGYENPVIGYAVNEMYTDYPDLMNSTQGSYVLTDVINAMNDAMTASSGEKNEIYNSLMENIVDKLTVRDAVLTSQYDLMNDPDFQNFRDAVNSGDYHTASMLVPDINRNDPNSDAWKIAGIARWTIKQAESGNEDVLTFGG